MQNYKQLLFVSVFGSLSVLLFFCVSFAATSIACVGNSITAGYGLSDTTKRYPSVMLKNLQTTYVSNAIVNPSTPLVASNLGVSGRTLLKKGNQPYWVEPEFSKIFTLKPSVITIMLGTNDTKPVNWTYASEFEQDYTAMIDTFSTMSSHPKIILCIPPAIFQNTMTISDSVMVNGVIPKIRNVAKAKGLPIIDTRTPTLSQKSLFGDGVHPNANGDKILADVFYEGILNFTTSQIYKLKFLWYGDAPGIIGAGTDTLAKPILHVYPAPDSINTHAAVIICPGGGYTHLAIQKEGDTVAQWFAKKGVSAFVLRYRYSPYMYPVPLNDAKRAMRMVRYYADAYGIDTAKIGIMGFSAGGHVASYVGTHYDNGNAASADPIERKKSKSDFMALIYPVITMTGQYTHTGSRDALLGTSPAPSTALLDSLSNQKWVNAQTSQTFLAHGDADVTVPIQNSKMFDSACAANNVAHKLVIDPGKAHGFGMAGVWPDSLISWMKTRGIVKPPVGIGSLQTKKSVQLQMVITRSVFGKEIKLSFTGKFVKSAAIYSVTGKRVAEFSGFGVSQYVWRPTAQGVYLVRAIVNGCGFVEKVNVAF